MGQTRTSLLALQKVLTDSPQAFDQLLAKRKVVNTKISELANTAHNGWDLMFMHLTSKFQAQKQTFDANAKKTLKEVMDPQLGKLVAGLESWRKDMVLQARAAATDFQAGVGALSTQLATAKSETATLRKTVEKKKARLLVSAKYKTKVKGYLEAIDAIDALCTSQTSTMAKAKAMTFDETWVNKYYSVRLDMTVEDIKGNATMDVTGIMKTYLQNQTQADTYVRTLRDEYKGMAGQLASMKAWSAEADDMEAEGDASGEGKSAPVKPEAAKPDPKPGVNKIVIKMGSTEVGTAVKGEYDRATKLLTIPVVVWKGKTAPLEYLQKKLTLSGSYENAAEGKFANDMKLDKLAGDMKKATFKGA
ncbi:MAG: hypothetical protein ABIO45_19320 [Burkholderiaceae bacterium]